MPEWTVNWECRVHGTSTVEADTEEEARSKVDLDSEGVELSNINELYPSEATVTDVEYFQD